MIDSAAQGCGAVSCAGYAVLHAAWVMTGAEPLSQVADKGWSNVSTGDKVGAVAAMAAVVPAGRVVEVAAPVVKEITLTVAEHGEAAVHAADAIKAGKSDVLTIARDGAAANRKAAIGGMEKVPGKQLDEYPAAMFKEGGSGASVRAIKPSDNMSAGACIGNACRGLPNGAKIKIRVEDN
jgi:filamentous hemagglutinin